MVRDRITYVLLVTLMLLFAAASGSANEEGQVERSSTGFRARLAEQGVTVTLDYTGEVFGVAGGGIDNGSDYQHLIQTPLSIDLKRAVGLSGAEAYFNSQWVYGKSPSILAGDLQTVSNIDAADTWKVYEVWYQQSLIANKLSVLVGLFDLNTEFDVIERAGVFVNSSFGIGPDYSQGGENGPSIFPTTSLAVRIEGHPTDELTTRVAVFDGVAGDPDNPHGTKVKLDTDDGYLVAAEGGVQLNSVRSARIVLGGWFYTKATPHLNASETGASPVPSDKNRGVYGLIETTVWTDAEDSREVAVFSRAGFADKEVNRLGSYLGGGITASGLISRRFENTLGLAFAAAFNTGRYRALVEESGAEVTDAEIAIELTGQFDFFRGLIVQPDLQYIMNPDSNPALDNVVFFSLRVFASL